MAYFGLSKLNLVQANILYVQILIAVTTGVIGPPASKMSNSRLSK